MRINPRTSEAASHSHPHQTRDIITWFNSVKSDFQKKSLSYLFIYIHTDKIVVFIYIFILAGLWLISVSSLPGFYFFLTYCV